MDSVLVVEDDQDVARALEVVLTRDGFDVTLASSGASGLRLFHTNLPDVVVLDVGLPDMEGWTVLAVIRESSHRPVLLLTAYGDEDDRVRGLRSGADDYLTKPFSNKELVARVESLIRRSRALPETSSSVGDGPLVVFPAEHQVRVEGRTVGLTRIEFDLARIFAEHPNQVLSTSQLMDTVWNDHVGVGSDRVKFAVLRLRRKLGASVHIDAVRGLGYRYCPDPA